MSPRIPQKGTVALGNIPPYDPAQLRSYGKNDQHSFFRDLLYTTLDDDARRLSRADPVTRGRQGMFELLPRDYDLEAARVRLKMAANAARAHYDLSAAVATALIPTSQLPPELAQLYEVAARNRAAVAQTLDVQPIPADTGMTVAITRMDSGATVAIMSSENSSASNTDPTFSLPASAIGYAAGYVDVSRQLVDRSAEGSKIDAVIARELGRAAGELIDGQLLNGSGTSGQITGLLGLAGNTVTFTQGTPTPALISSKLGELYFTVASNYGIGPDLLLWHPRRSAFAHSQADTGDSVRRVLSLYDTVTEAPCMPTTLSTTQDAVIAVRREAVHAFADSRFEVHTDAKSSTLKVRFRVIVRVALVLGSDDAVAKMTGSGLTTPAWAT